MNLTELGQGRIRGYLFVLSRSLRTFMPREMVADAVKEVESHILERVAQAPQAEDERTSVEMILDELGTPLRVAQAYSAELKVEEAVTTGGMLAVPRAALLLAARTATGFLAAIGLFTGYAAGLGFIAIAILKPIFPDNVGFFVRDGLPIGFGGIFPAPAGAQVHGGYWVIPLALAVGLAVLLVTHGAARRLLMRWRERRGWGPGEAIRELRRP